MTSASTFLVTKLYIIKCSHFLVCQKPHCFRVRAAHSKEEGGTIIVFRDVLRPLVIAEYFCKLDLISCIKETLLTSLIALNYVI